MVEVELPRSQLPIFPDRCLQCHLDTAERMPWCVDVLGFSTILWWLPRKRFCVDIPMCQSCGPALRSQRAFQRSIGVVLALSAGLLGWLFLSTFDLSFRMRYLLTLGIIVSVVVPYSIWAGSTQYPFDMSVMGDTVTYEFADTEFATEFARVNGVPREQ